MTREIMSRGRMSFEVTLARKREEKGKRKNQRKKRNAPRGVRCRVIRRFAGGMRNQLGKDFRLRIHASSLKFDAKINQSRIRK